MSKDLQLDEIDIILAKHNGEIGVSWEDPDVVTPDTKQAISNYIETQEVEARIGELKLIEKLRLAEVSLGGAIKLRIGELESLKANKENK